MDSARILIVDDNTSNIQVLANHLSAKGYQFEFALSGSVALEWLQKETFDLILLDIMMPEMDGFETIQHIRANEKLSDLPVIFLSARTETEAITKGFMLGGQDYVMKPFNGEELESRIQSQLAQKRSKEILKDFNEVLEKKVEERTVQLKEAYSIIQSIVDNVPAIFFQRKAENEGFIFVSAYFETLTGYSPELFMAPDNTMVYEDIIHKADNGVEENVSPFDKIHRIVRSDGAIRWVSPKINKRLTLGSNDSIIEGIVHDVSSKVEEEERIMSSVLKAEDKERVRVARELHDGVQQSLAALFMSLDMVRKPIKEKLDPEKFEQYEKSLKTLNGIISEIREISHRLVPKSIEQFGLNGVVYNMIENYQKGGEFKFDYHQNIEDERFEIEVELNVYRIIQETLNNAFKYSKAKNITIQLIRGADRLSLIVEDDGVGFDKAGLQKGHGGFGLLSIESRVMAVRGELFIETAPGRGTSVMVQIPIEV
ncbi:MAG: response regulator [Cytophagia bacterium]|nr:response regulator [Cytophagia bacterium]